MRHIAKFLAVTAILAFSIISPYAMADDRRASAPYISDIPALLEIRQTPDYQTYQYLQSYPALLRSREIFSSDISAFGKWRSMFARFETQLTPQYAAHIPPLNIAEIQRIHELRQQISALDIWGNANNSNQITAFLTRINQWANQYPYIEDKKNWGKSDYWATPLEFIEKGGDCEDFAIAKYTALRALGVPENRLRLAVVDDLVKSTPHAVLIVYTDESAYILDNQNDQIINSAESFRYRPIFSINRHGWWLHQS